MNEAWRLGYMRELRRGVAIHLRGYAGLRLFGMRLSRVRGRLYGLPLVKNLIIRCAVVLDKMGIAFCNPYAFMARPDLGCLDAFGAIDGGNKEMTKIVRSDSFRINPRFSDALLDVVPHIAGVCLDDLIPGALVVTDKNRGGFRDCAGSEVVAHGIGGAVRELYNRLFSTFAGNKRPFLKQIHVRDTQAASLRDTQARIGQKQNIRSISEFFGRISYSIHVVNDLLYSSLVELDYGLFGSEGVMSVELMKEGGFNPGVVVQSLDGGSAKRLRGWGHAGRAEQKFFIRLLREFGVIANNVEERLQAVLIRPVGLWRARLIYEIQIGIYSVFHGGYVPSYNANYIRKD